jgi:beta-glucosidase/6-phospho-beta-glucosidase/beta-galactosidase
VKQKRLFASFFQAGFECSTHKLKRGKRLDLIASTQHDRFLTEDYQRLIDCNIRTVREGIRWHLIEPKRGKYDFSTVLPFLEISQRMGVQIIWDVLHFGWPDFVDIFSPDWVNAFTDFTEEFAQLLAREMSSTCFVTPVNEISFLAWGGGDAAYINPFAKGRGRELKYQLARAAIAASSTLRAEISDLKLVACEPVIHIVGDPNRPEDVRQAEEYRTSMFEAWDMLTGKLAPELGGKASYLDIIGVNYYDRNQWWNYGETIWRHEKEYRPFRQILKEVYDRYRRPMFVAETGTEDQKRPSWFGYICDEVRGAQELGVPMQGLCLYPILNHPGWEDDRHCHNGLWDYADEHGARPIYEPLADELRRQQQRQQEDNYDQLATPSR